MCHFFVSYAMPQFRLLLYSIYAYFTITLRCYDKLWFGFIRSHHLVLPLSSTTFELNTKSERARKRESEKKIKKIYANTLAQSSAEKNFLAGFFPNTIEQNFIILMLWYFQWAFRTISYIHTSCGGRSFHHDPNLLWFWISWIFFFPISIILFYEHILLHSSNKHTANTSRIEDVYRCTYIDFWFLFPLFFLITVLRAFHIFHTPHVLSSRDRSGIKKKEESNSEMRKKSKKVKIKVRTSPSLR